MEELLMSEDKNIHRSTSRVLDIGASVCRILNFLHYPLWYQNQIVYAEDSIRWIASLAQLVHKRWPPFGGSHLNDITVF